VKVLLVNPYQADLVSSKGRIYNRRWPPLDLANCAAILEQKDVDVTIVDANAEHLGPEEVAGRARGYDKAFVTSTSLDRWQCPQLDIKPFLQTVHALRQVLPEVYVLGSHGTVRPIEMLTETQATAVVRGEPEITVREICAGTALSEIGGVTYLSDGKPVSNPDQKPVPMDELPLPAFHLLPMHHYHYEVLGDRFAMFEMSRGCASDCTFCLLKTYGVGVRKKSIDRLMAEIEYGIREFGIRTAYFMDLEFTVLRKQVVDLCCRLIEKQYDFKWCCQTRLDLVDEELLSLMKRAGCVLIHSGVEAGSDEVLRTVKKEITMRSIEQGMAMIHAAGMETACFFLIGFPESGRSDMQDLIRFARKLNPTYALFHVTAPYPGTELYEQVRNDPNVRFSDGSLFPEAIEGALKLPELKAMTRNAYLQFYLRPTYLWSRLRRGEVKALSNQVRLFWQFVRS